MLDDVAADFAPGKSARNQPKINDGTGSSGVALTWREMLLRLEYSKATAQSVSLSGTWRGTSLADLSQNSNRHCDDE